MRISDWSSDVCSSDLATGPPRAARRRTPATATRWQPAGTCPGIRRRRRWLLVVGLDGVVGGELPVLQPGELLDRRVILRDHRPAPLIGQSRSEARRAGKEGASTCRPRGEPYP